MQYIRGYYDTNIGPKTAAKSYRTICKEINLKPSDVLFLTDSPGGLRHFHVNYHQIWGFAEAVAALEAGLKICLVERNLNNETNSEAFAHRIHSFDEIFSLGWPWPVD